MKIQKSYNMSKILVLLFAAIIAGTSLFVWTTAHPQAQPKTSAPTVTAAAKQTPAPRVLKSSAIVVGEVFWGRGIDYFAKQSADRYAFPFTGLTNKAVPKYDNWIAHMECPVTTTDIPYQTQADRLRFNCRPEYLTEASKHFNIMALANNHVCDNRGETGQAETRANLQRAGIQHFGDCHPANTDNICEVVALRARILQGKKQTETMIPIALCGYVYVVNVTPAKSELAAIKKYAKAMPVIVTSQMGVEYRATAEEPKVTAYRRMIDAGADAVLGAHPHVIQDSENYKGKLIQYSSGNFLFDQQSLGKDEIISLGIGIDVEITDQKAVAAYETVGRTCTAFKDTCLEKLQKLLASRPSIKASYSPNCFTHPRYTPEPANKTTCTEIKRQATWDSAAASLSRTW